MDADVSLSSANGQMADQLPFSLLLELTVIDAEVIAELWARQEGRDRDNYALSALRLGVLALRQATGQLDADTLKREGERLLADVRLAIGEHRTHLDRSLVGTLKEYFDPDSGRFSERIDRLLKKDGDLETLLAKKITADDSEMCRSLAAHVGKDSPLFKLLSPNESEGVLKAMQSVVSDELENQRKQVLSEFSLDNKEGALSRLIGELTDNNGKLRSDVQAKIDEMLKQFSFDDENSALSRLKREVMGVLKTHGEASQKFQEEVRITLEKMQARREEAAASTRHGIDFESQVFGMVQAEAQRQRDIATDTGNSVGLIKNCKKGDAVVELGPDSPAPESKIVVEAKEHASYDLSSALIEIGEARRNRGADCGLFVFSQNYAPTGLEPLARYGDDVVVTWNPDEPSTDMYLRLGLSVARALCTRKAAERQNLAVDFSAIDAAIREIVKQCDELDKIRTWTETIRSNGERILDRVRISREKLTTQANVLTEKVEDLKHYLTAT